MLVRKTLRYLYVQVSGCECSLSRGFQCGKIEGRSAKIVRRRKFQPRSVA